MTLKKFLMRRLQSYLANYVELTPVMVKTGCPIAWKRKKNVKIKEKPSLSRWFTS